MIFLDLFENNKLPSNTQGVAEDQTPEQEIERLKLRQNAEHGGASLRRQAATQARIRELEKQIKDKKGVAEGSEEMVGFHLDSERAYEAVMARFGHVIDHDEDSGIMYVPERLWPTVEAVAYDADGIGAQRDDDLENPEHYGVAEGYFSNDEEREQSAMDVTRSARQYREREPAGSEKIDAMLARRNEQLRQYELSGKYWLKTKDTQQHVEGPFTGKQAANAAAIELLKRAPELKGNLLITAKGPNDKVDEAARLPYPEGSENLGRANMELLIRAYNEPTSPRLVLNFGNQSIDLDRDDINAIADYYDDQLPSNDARWNFIRAVMSNHENFTTVLGKLGRRKMPMAQPGLFQEENKKKDDDLGSQVKDVGLQRAITRAKADFPTAGTGIEALAKDFMRSQDQDKKEFDQIRQADQRQNKMLGQIAKVDQDQQEEIKDLENKNSTLAQRLQQLQAVNSRLEKTLADMSGRKPKAATKTTAPKADATANVVPEPVVAKTPAAQEPEVKQLANEPGDEKDTGAMANMATQLAPDKTPQIANEPSDNILPPTFRRAENPEFARARAGATDIASRPSVDPSVIVPRKAPQDQELELAAENKDKDFDKFGPEWDAMVKRVGKVAKAGPLKTVWDPVKRVYKNVPVNTPKTQN